jgi:hypothetical protein
LAVDGKLKWMQDHRTWFGNIGSALLSDVCFNSETLDTFPESVHVGILENIDGHNNLVISESGKDVVLRRKNEVNLQ